MHDDKYQALAAVFHQEQKHLQERIREWRDWSQELSELGQPRFGEMNDRVRVIQRLLKNHFQHEEQSGIFQEVAEMSAPNAEQSARLLYDHQRLLKEINRLCARLSAEDPDFEGWGEANRMFEALLEELETHEREEAGLIDEWAESNANA